MPLKFIGFLSSVVTTRNGKTGRAIDITMNLQVEKPDNLGPLEKFSLFLSKYLQFAQETLYAQQKMKIFMTQL